MKIEKEFVATVYIVNKGRILINRNKKLNKFIPLGGHIEKNETPQETAIREAKEESGFDIELVNPRRYGRKNLIQNFDIGEDIVTPYHHHINISFLGKIISGNPLEVADDGTELKWVTKEELLSLPDEEVVSNLKGAGVRALKIFEELKKYKPSGA